MLYILPIYAQTIHFRDNIADPMLLQKWKHYYLAIAATYRQAKPTLTRALPKCQLLGINTKTKIEICGDLKPDMQYKKPSFFHDIHLPFEIYFGDTFDTGIVAKLAIA
jgi:hypothetical protein